MSNIFSFSYKVDQIEPAKVELETSIPDDLMEGFEATRNHFCGDVVLSEAKKLLKVHGDVSGTHAKVYKLSGEHDEGDPYHVKLFKGGKHYEPADYFTDDEEDAHSTAEHMIKESVESIEEARKLLKVHGEISGTHAKVYKLSGEHDEGDPYHVKLFKGGKHYEPADYFTDDEEDAHSTAAHMIKESTGVTNYNPKSQGGTRKELLDKLSADPTNRDLASKAVKAGASNTELRAAIGKVMKESCPINVERIGGTYSFSITHGGEVIAEGIAPTESGAMKGADRKLESIIDAAVLQVEACEDKKRKPTKVYDIVKKIATK